ncbi:MAG: O-antigen ligase family protein [Lachnospiraceae bacterium]
MNIIKERYVVIIERIFRLCYLCLVLSTFTSYLYDSPIQLVLVKATLVLGCVALLLRCFFLKKYIKMPYWVLLALFCVSFAISAFVNREYGILENGKWLIWTAFQMALLYIVDTKRPIQEDKKEFRIFSHIIMIFCFFASIISLWWMISGYVRIWDTVEQEMLISGFCWGRLWGVFIDPNYGAVLIVISMVLSVYFFLERKGKLRILYGLNIFLNFLYLIFTDSRSGELCFVVGMSFFVGTWIWKKKEGETRFKKIGMCLMCVVCLSVVFLGSVRVIKSEYNRQLAPRFAKVFASTDKKEEKGIKNYKAVDKKSGVGRDKKDLKGDVTNGRIELWKSGVEIWSTSPIFGTGYTTLLPYIKEHLPDSYAINNEHGEYSNMHNAFVNILVYQGVAGIVLFGIFTMSVFFYIWKYMWKVKDEDFGYVMCMITCVGCVVISMCVLLEGVYTNSPGSFVLWSFLGYLVHYGYCQKEEMKTR